MCCLFLFVILFNSCTQEKKINEIVQSNYDNITKITFFNGRTGEKAIVDNDEKIKEFTNLLDSYVVKKIAGSPEVKPGPAYSVQLYAGDTMAFTLQILSLESNSNLGIDGIEYRVLETNVTNENLEDFFR